MKDIHEETLPEIILEEFGLEVADHVNAMLAYWDINEVCRFANKAYYEWFGKSREEMIGKMTLEDLLGDLYQKNIIYIKLALKGKQQTFEREIITPSGEIRQSIATYYPHVINEKVQGIFVHVADITVIKTLERELKQALLREKKLNEIQHQFATTISNEFKAPMSVILSSLALIEKYVQLGGEDEKIKKHLDRIRSSINELADSLSNTLSPFHEEPIKIFVKSEPGKSAE